MEKRIVFLLLLIVSVTSSALADALSNEQERVLHRQQLCREYAVKNPATFVSDYEKKEKQEIERLKVTDPNWSLRMPRFSEKPDSYWTDEMNSDYDADGVPTIGVEIVICKEAKEPRLLIPQKLSSYIRKDLKNLKVSESAAPSRTQTIALGMLMSLAMVSGGVWLFRSKQSRNVKIIAVLGIATFGLTISTAILASADYGEALRSKQRIVRDLQTYNIAQDFGVQFYIMEDRSDLRDVVLIVPQNYSKPKEIKTKIYPADNAVNRQSANFGSDNSNFAGNSPASNAAKPVNATRPASNQPPRNKKP